MVSTRRPQGQRIGGYDVHAVLGYGASSTIYEVEDPRNGTRYALKQVICREPADNRYVVQVVNEHRISRQLEHPAFRKCIRLRRQRRLLKTRQILLLMELVHGKTLLDQQPKDLRAAIEIFMSAADALAEMHRAGLIHTDIKPNNIIVTAQSEIKIIDFGQSCPIDTVKDRVQGTPDYIAPEQVRRKRLTARTDVYNLGATMYWCLSGASVPARTAVGTDDAGMRQDREVRPLQEVSPDIPIGRTEIEAYNGHLIRLAGDFPCPLNRAALGMVEKLTREDLQPERKYLDAMAATLPEGVLA